MDNRIEFFRHAVALLPEPGDPRPGVAVLYRGPTGKFERTCTCGVSKRITCPHVKALSRIYKALELNQGELEEVRRMKATALYRSLSFLLDHHPVPVDEVAVQLTPGHLPVVRDRQGEVLVEYQRDDAGAARFVDRLVEGSLAGGPSRAGVLSELVRLTRTPIEWQMVSNQTKTRRQAAEESLWFRLAYHLFRELGPDARLLLSPIVEQQSGAFMLSCRAEDQSDICRVAVPPLLVERFLLKLAEVLPGTGIPVHPIPLQSILRVSPSTEVDVVEVEPALRLIGQSGEERFFSREDLARFQYGDLQYIPELNLLVRLPNEHDQNRKFVSPKRMKLAESQIASFISDAIDPDTGASSLVGLDIIDRFDRVELSASALDRDWCWLDVRYGAGDLTVSLREILAARESGERFVRTGHGWIDTAATDVECLLKRGGAEGDAPSGGVKMSRLDVLGLGAELESPVTVRQAKDGSNGLENLWHFKPMTALAPLDGLRSTLREYQRAGAEWLLFLADNGFGGLLCDDMGLGKTHQLMALMVALREQRGETRPFLVVSPSTVLSHWRRLTERFAPGLKVALYYGPSRDLEAAVSSDLLLTSYGVLRNDVEALREVAFALAAFDEIHVAKNRATIAFDAASKIRAASKIGITGTPVENRPAELWSLMELVMPGYLGAFEAFSKRYESPDRTDFGDLSRRIRPFSLRRLKSSVLRELPPKIEDIRTCTLSGEQVGLYRNVVATKGQELVLELSDTTKKIPYLHIFQVLGLLKQICDHPSLVTGAPVGEHDSGKMALLSELLDETLASGHKVVVYSQYVKMIDIISSLLDEKSVPHAVLTGKSRNRGAIVERFNTDDRCRVFVGSLLAGGVGIDLTAASVVIHYDRWWNAAKEDQATDRVHRIGQDRSVHVLKLVTEGTLEEKISALIEKKRALMDQIIKEDDPKLLKGFDREELSALLSLSV